MTGTTGATRRQVLALVRGTVQGVGFRYYTLDQAQRLGLAGTVRNLPNGSVEVVAEGPADGVQQLVDWLHRGPSSAHVIGVHVQERTPTGLTRFEIGH